MIDRAGLLDTDGTRHEPVLTAASSGRKLILQACKDFSERRCQCRWCGFPFPGSSPRSIAALWPDL